MMQSPRVVRVVLVLAIVLCSLLLHMDAFAQTTFPLSLSIGDFGSYGYESPYSEIGAGIERRSHRVMVETRAAYSPTAKNTVGDGYGLSGRAALLIRPVRPLFVGGGLTRSKIQNSQWSKTAQRSFLTAGLDNDRWRIALTREIPGSDPNALTGWTASARVNVSRHVRIGGELFASTFRDQFGQPQSASGFLLHLDYVLGRK